MYNVEASVMIKRSKVVNKNIKLSKNLDKMGQVPFLLDEMGLDKMGLDEMAINRRLSRQSN